MPKAKTIQLFLIDGISSGRIKSSIQNWTGVLYKIPRAFLDLCNKGNIAQHLNNAGVYFLFGENEEGNITLYVGKADRRNSGQGIFQRINEHKNDVNYWNEIVILTTQVESSLTQTEISFLENQFTNKAIEAKRSQVINKNIPNRSNPSEEKIAELEEFMENALLAIGTLGYKVFEQPVERIDEKLIELNNSKVSATSELFICQSSKYKAAAVRNNEGFVLLKQSQINPKLSFSAGDSTRKLREKYKFLIDENSVTTADIVFKSPSGAGAFVTGSPVNGNNLWKTASGKSPNDF